MLPPRWPTSLRDADTRRWLSLDPSQLPVPSCHGHHFALGNRAGRSMQGGCSGFVLAGFFSNRFT